MRGIAARFFHFGTAFVCLIAVGWVVAGHAAKPVLEGMPTDWSHRHVIFSQPTTDARAAVLANEPRFWQQQYRRSVVRPVLDEADSAGQMTILGSGLGTSKTSSVHRDWSEDLGSGGSVGAGNFPAKYNFLLTTANCANTSAPDFVVFNTGLLSNSTTASIVAFDNLYSGCSGTVPSGYWAYDTQGQILTSPVLSLDGKQVAFVQTNGFAQATLVLLKWKSSTSETISSPLTLTPVASLNAYSTCTAPCMAEIPLTDRGGFPTDDTNSSVFYDYAADTAWVGDSESYLHKFNPVFKGIPAEVRNTTWPLQVNAANPTQLSGPVHDLVSGNIFMGDLGGFVERVNATTGAITKSAQLDHGAGIVASPVVDSTSQKVYVFVSDDGSTACASGPCAAVDLFTTTFAANTVGSKVTVGSSSTTPQPLYDGGFDSTYEASTNATGNLYVCGNTGGAPTLYKIPITTGTVGGSVAGPTLTSAATGCSPVSDVSNLNATGGPAEWVFAGVQASGSGNNCAASGCIMNFLNQPWKPSTNYTVGQLVIDTHFQIQVAIIAGKSGTTTPGWSTVVDASTSDSGVTWVNQGPQVAFHAAWAPATSYTLHTAILDTNNNIQIVVKPGTSKTGAPPVWSTTINQTTVDGSVDWHMLGAAPTASLAAAGGTSGVILDNTLSSGTLAGASQVYFSTLSNQTCGTTGTGGCAVQASQSALH